MTKIAYCIFLGKNAKSCVDTVFLIVTALANKMAQSVKKFSNVAYSYISNCISNWGSIDDTFSRNSCNFRGLFALWAFKVSEKIGWSAAKKGGNIFPGK